MTQEINSEAQNANHYAAAEDFFNTKNLEKNVTVNTKIQNFFKSYKALTEEEKGKLFKTLVVNFRELFVGKKNIDFAVHFLCKVFARERDWNSALLFLKSILSEVQDTDFYKEVSLILLEIAENHVKDKNMGTEEGQTALLLVTEFGVMLAHYEGLSRLDHSNSDRVVEYITTSLLARSNVNNSGMRITLLNYLSRNPNYMSGTNQLNKVVGRFGQTLLEELLTSYFEDKKKETAAFLLLTEHLHIFMSISPNMDDMAHAVFRRYMLKYPEQFPQLLASYCEAICLEQDKHKLMLRHLTHLYKYSLEVFQKDLVNQMGYLLHSYLQKTAEAHKNILNDQVNTVIESFSNSPTLRAERGIIVADFIKAVQALVLPEKESKKILSLSRLKKPKDSSFKIVTHNSTELNQLEKVFAIAC